MRPAYPLVLDLTDRVVVIIGGGVVAARKAAGVIAAGAKEVRVVAPALTAKMPESIKHVAQRYEPHHLHGAGLIFATTDQPEVNASVVRDARRAGVLVNRADTDETDPGDFTVPAVLRRDALTVAVSTGGTPALAARVRDAVADSLPPQWIELAKKNQAMRPIVMRMINDPARRREIFLDLASDDAAKQLASGGEEALRDWLQKRHPQLFNK